MVFLELFMSVNGLFVIILACVGGHDGDREG